MIRCQCAAVGVKDQCWLDWICVDSALPLVHVSQATMDGARQDQVTTINLGMILCRQAGTLAQLCLACCCVLRRIIQPSFRLAHCCVSGFTLIFVKMCDSCDIVLYCLHMHRDTQTHTHVCTCMQTHTCMHAHIRNNNNTFRFLLSCVSMTKQPLSPLE